MFYLKRIKIINFRCFDRKEIELLDKINIIVGDNAVGKTSIAESVYLLSCCKSHRTNSDNDILKKGKDFYTLIADVVLNPKESDNIKLCFDGKGKKVLKNEKLYPNLSDYIGYIHSVIFCPEDLKLINGEPSLRRRFLDLYISQIDKDYLISLIKYKKILKNRNEYLKKSFENVDLIYLETITNALINEGKIIIDKRKEYINRLNDHFNDVIAVISGNEECGKLVYNPNVSVENFQSKMKENLEKDLIMQTTLFGPHKDDMEILIDNEKASVFASQGQQRTLALALKLAQAYVVKKKSERIIIILDDVFAELDKKRQNNIIKILNYDCQIIITTTSIDELSKSVLKNSNVIEIDKGGDTNE